VTPGGAPLSTGALSLGVMRHRFAPRAPLRTRQTSRSCRWKEATSETFVPEHSGSKYRTRVREFGSDLRDVPVLRAGRCHTGPYGPCRAGHDGVRVRVPRVWVRVGDVVLGRWGWVVSVYMSSWVWRHADAAGNDLLVLLALADAADDECPSVGVLERKTRLSESTVRRCLTRLCEAGLLVRESRPGMSNRYVITTSGGCQSDTPPGPEGCQSDTPPGPEGCQSDRGRGVNLTGEGCQSDTPERGNLTPKSVVVVTTNTTTTTNTNTSSPLTRRGTEIVDIDPQTPAPPEDPPAADDATEGPTLLPVPDLVPATAVPARATRRRPSLVPDRFEEFWGLYPRRVSKGQAVKAWGAALKLPGVDAATILAGLTAQLPALAARDPRYVKHPSSWLNAQCWADEIDAKPQVSEWDHVPFVSAGRVRAS